MEIDFHKYYKLILAIFFLAIFLIKCSVFAQNQKWMVYNTSNSILPSNYVTSIAEDHNGGIWIGTYGGLVSISDNVWKVYNTSNSNLPSNQIETIAVDSNNAIWIGFLNAGLVKYSNNIMEHFTTQNSKLPSDWVTKIIVDRLNRKWIATETGYGAGGVLVIDDTSFISYTEANSELPNGEVSSIDVDDSLNAWIGMIYLITDPGPITGGLAKYDGRNWKFFDYNTPGFTSNSIDYIEADKDTIWVGSIDGLSKFNGQSWSTYSDENSELPTNYVNTILAESNGVKWIGVGRARFDRKGALVKYANGSFIKYDTTNSPILPGYVTSIFIDLHHNMWIAIQPYWNINTATSYGGGLVTYNENGIVGNIDDKYKENIYKEFSLADNYPNPFNPTTMISYSLPKYGFTKLQVYNLLGRKVATLINKYESAGIHKVKFDGTHLASGIYFYTLNFRNKIISKKMLLLK